MEGGDKNPGSTNINTKLDQMVIGNIVKNIATECHILG